MTGFLHVDIGIYALIILLIILFSIRLRHRGSDNSIGYLRFVCWSAIAVTILDIIPWLAEGQPGRGMEILNYLSNFLLLLFSSLPLIGWICYLDRLIYRSGERLKKRFFYAPYFLIAVLALGITPFTGFVFTLDGGNRYHRGPGIAVIAAINYLIVAQAFLLVIRQRESVDKPFWLNLFLFALLPTAGATLQMRFYGLMTTWPFTVLAILMTYLFLEVQRETRDYLTGLLNRRQIDECLQSRKQDFPRSGPFCVMMIDLDGFKKINDTLGHKTGDLALVSMSHILLRSVKKTDRVGRYGGDEFLILLETDSEEVALRVIERIGDQVERENGKGGNPYSLAFSAGYAFYTPPLSLEEITEKADRMMYRMKKEKKKKIPLSL